VSKRVNLIIGGILSIAAIVLLNLYITSKEKNIADDLKKAFTERYKTLTSVMVATQDIPRGSEVTANMVETQVIPEKYVQPQAATSLDRIAGMRVIASIAKGEQITLGKLTSPQKARARSLAMATPVGKRAITINIDNIASLAGMIRPGDYVDLFTIISAPMQTPEGKQIAQLVTIPLFQNVLVLAVGVQLATEEPPDSRFKLGTQKPQAPQQRGSSSLVTLALTPQEASLLSFVSEQGKIRLILRSPADAKVHPLPPANWETLFLYTNSLLPPKPGEEPKPIEIKREPRRIEIYRGLNKEYIAVSE